jgi:uncharacterized protein (TIGR03000 family)
MVRHWFSLTAVLAVAVLVIAADASPGQLRQRRQNRRARRNNTVNNLSNGQALSGPYYIDSSGRLVDSTGSLASSFVEEGVGQTPNGGRLSMYPPERLGSPRGARSVRLEVRVAPDAEVLIDGAKTTTRGPVRQFISPPIEPRQSPYTYQIQAKWMENGQERTQTRTVDVQPGQLVRLDLTRPSEERQ